MEHTYEGTNPPMFSIYSLLVIGLQYSPSHPNYDIREKRHMLIIGLLTIS